MRLTGKYANVDGRIRLVVQSESGDRLTYDLGSASEFPNAITDAIKQLVNLDQLSWIGCQQSGSQTTCYGEGSQSIGLGRTQEFDIQLTIRADGTIIIAVEEMI